MLYLKNASKTSAITLRYGVGSRKLIQVNPGCQIQKPFDLTSGEVQKYLGIFKDLSVIDIPENEVIDNVENGENNDSENSINNSNDSDSNDESEQQNEKVQGNSNEQESNEEVGRSDGSSEETKSNESNNDEEKSNEQSSSDEQNGSTDSGHVCEGNCNGEQCKSGATSKELYTESQLKKMDINLVRDVALKLNIMVKDEDKKKDLIAVILKQQEELQK